MEASNIVTAEKVQVLNLTNGERLETYVTKGAKGSGDIFINGPAAKKISKGDEVIIVSYALVDFEDASIQLLFFLKKETQFNDIKTKIYTCKIYGAQYPKWLGQCAKCGSEPN